MEKITDVTASVPYRGTGNIIRYTEVEFQIYRDHDRFMAVARDSDKDKRLTDLPERILFENRNNKWQLLDKGEEEVMLNIIAQLEKKKIVN